MTTNDKLRRIANILIGSDSGVDPYYNGILESKIKHAICDTKVEIGEAILEVLEDEEEEQDALDAEIKSQL